MSELTSSVALPYPAFSEKLKFYGIWIVTALILLALPKIFGSGALTTFSLIGISIIFSYPTTSCSAKPDCFRSATRSITALAAFW
jgi:hypothetical protein